MNKRLSNYIENIEAGSPINLGKFYKLVDSLLEGQRQPMDVDAVKHSGQLYIVTKINDRLMNELRLLTADSGGTRAGAGIQNRSHLVNVRGSYLLVRDQLKDPVVVMMDGGGEYRLPISQSKEALVIENRQNFIDARQMVSFLEKHTDFKLAGMNIVFAEGNEITNRLHKKFLSGYTRLHLCMDFDLGGLTITNSLMSLLPDASFNFLVPDDIEQRLDRVVQRVDKLYIEKVIKIGLSTPLLVPHAKLIRDKQKTLEQESYLHG